ncbi:MAG: RNA methyltransferase [Bryobacterales bacterium]|nr:RNA methyltransferase [Bryobacterales bacterium]
MGQMPATAVKSGRVAPLIESAANTTLKRLRKSLAQGALFDGRYWVAETPKLLAEALRSGLSVPAVYAEASRVAEFRAEFGNSYSGEWIPLAARALRSLASVETSQGLLALVERPIVEPSAFFPAQKLLVVLDRIQDPGNAGAILRSAEAFGATGAVFLAGSTSADGPKLLRASAGSRFRMPVLEGLTAPEFIEKVHHHAVHLYAAAPGGGLPLDQVSWRFPAALIVGNEGAGLDPELLRRATAFRIPTQGVESLNAAISAAIALYAAGAARARED